MSCHNFRFQNFHFIRLYQMFVSCVVIKAADMASVVGAWVKILACGTYQKNQLLHCSNTFRTATTLLANGSKVLFESVSDTTDMGSSLDVESHVSTSQTKPLILDGFLSKTGILVEIIFASLKRITA